MKLLDYTGKINTHVEYLEILNKLEKKCEYIEYVLVDEDDTGFIEKFHDYIIAATTKNKWWGTRIRGRGCRIYKLKSSKEIFRYLQKYETFCRYTFSNIGDNVETTDFGMNDIAFFDDGELPLLFTTTHEGYITIRDDL